MHILFHVPMPKNSKKKASTRLIFVFLTNMRSLSGPHLASLYQKWWLKQISDLQPLNKCIKCNKYLLPFSHDILKLASGDNFLQKLISWFKIIHMTWKIPSDVCHYHSYWQSLIQALEDGPQLCSWLWSTVYKSWNKSYKNSIMSKYIVMTLEPSPKPTCTWKSIFSPQS